MSYWFQLVHLDVGQGTGTFLEVYDDADNLVHTALFDFGSDHDVEVAGEPSVAYVANQLKKMEQPTLDAVILSHSDSDHISLLGKLLKAFEPYNADMPDDDQLKVVDAVHGGAEEDYKKWGSNVLDKLAEYMAWHDDEDKQAAASLGREFSSFTTDPPVPLCKVGPVEVYILVGNHPNAQSGKVKDLPQRNEKGKLDAYSLNTVSLVTVLSYENLQMIETGDATGATIKWANRILTIYDDETGQVIKDVVGMTVPHHGSWTTMMSFGRAKDKGTTPKTTLTKFLESIKSWSYTVSASETNKHHHPSANLLDIFYETVQADNGYADPLIDPNHYYTAFFKANSFSRKTGKTTTTKWPPKWADKVYYTTAKTKVKAKGKAAVKGKVKDKPAYLKKPVKVKTPVDQDRLTVRMERPIYSTVYFSASTSAKKWEQLEFPPNPALERTPLVVTGGAEPPPLGYAWCYKTVIGDDGDKYETSLVPIQRRDAEVALMRAIDAGVPPEELPWPSAAESRQWAQELAALHAASPRRWRSGRGGRRAELANGSVPPSDSTPPTAPTAPPAPGSEAALSSTRPAPMRAVHAPRDPRLAVPREGSRMRTLRVIR